MTVPRKHLEIVAPDHPLQPEPDGMHAAWWLDQLDPWGLQGVPVSSLVPSSFPAVVQVLHPWRSVHDRVSWRPAATQLGFDSVPAVDDTREMDEIPAARAASLEQNPGDLDMVTARTLVDVLARATTTPDDVFVAVWEGWGDVPVQRLPGAADLDTHKRGHFLLRGPLTGVLESVATGLFRRPASGLWWPADRAWFVATVIDFSWTLDLDALFEVSHTGRHDVLRLAIWYLELSLLRRLGYVGRYIASTTRTFGSGRSNTCRQAAPTTGASSRPSPHPRHAGGTCSTTSSGSATCARCRPAAPGCLSGRRPDTRRTGGGLAYPSEDGGFEELRGVASSRATSSTILAS